MCTVLLLLKIYLAAGHKLRALIAFSGCKLDPALACGTHWGKYKYFILLVGFHLNSVKCVTPRVS